MEYTADEDEKEHRTTKSKIGVTLGGASSKLATSAKLLKQVFETARWFISSHGRKRPNSHGQEDSCGCGKTSHGHLFYHTRSVKTEILIK